MGKKILFILLALLFISWGNLYADQEPDTIELLHDAFATGESLEVGGEPIMATGLLSLFYQSRNFEPAWPDLSYAGRIIDLLGKSTEEGLFPLDYHFNALTAVYGKLQNGRGSSARSRAELDVLLSDAILIYASHLVNGKIAPSRFEKTWNYDSVQLLPEDIVYALNKHVDNQTVDQALESLKPDLAVYDQLKHGLSFFADLAGRDLFKEIPTKEVLRIGSEGTNVRELRRQLMVLGLLEDDAESFVFDEQLEGAVKNFQKRFGLEVDGIAGKATLEELNVPFSYRADQIRINMDRIRWVVDDLTPNFLLVNIAGYKLWLSKNDTLVWSTDVMTGAIRSQTPLFKSEMTYLVFNPTWTVPRSIAKEMFHKFQSDPSYISRNNYRLIDRQGKEVDPHSLNWSSLNNRNFPYTLVQMPGKNNALGRVKFMFPNKHAIYLHDTPQKHLFVKAQRAFSHGCIRVKDPLRLAELLLDDQDLWNRAAIDRVVGSKGLKNVKLKVPVEVLIMYWTVQPGSGGKLSFVQDVYGRDLALIAALKKPLF